jgi:rare lipoprotein A
MLQPANTGALRAMQACSTWPILILAFAGCAQQAPQQAAPQAPTLTRNDETDQCSQVGMASWYRGAWRDRTSSHDLVAAHRSLPFGTTVQVTAIDTGQSVVVRINDRGPFGHGRVIDLSVDAADQLGIRQEGVAKVRLQPVEWVAGNCPL